MQPSPPSSPEFAYSRLRTALELFGKPFSELTPDQISRAERQALREYEIETRILESSEAAAIVIGPEQVDRAFAEVKGRFPEESSFQSALAHNDLDEYTLKLGIARQCRVNTVLERIEAGVDAERISEVDIGLYYHSHFDSFCQPERRDAYHILISIHEDFPENSRTRARERIERIAERLASKPKAFEDLALKYSECPSAMRGGRIGLVRRGQLYPPLDEALFGMRAGHFSAPVESEMGFHILWCKAIQPPQTISLKKATPHIRRILRNRLKENRRRAWIASLIRPDAGE